MKLACLIILTGFLFFYSKACEAQVNIALGKPVKFDVAPNYALCTDSEDAIQLTDGKFAGEGFWFDKLAVGWHAGTSAVFSLDLGEAKPISGAMFSTVSRANAGVYWPTSIYLFVSDDGINYRYAGDLAVLGTENGVPEIKETENTLFQFKTTKLKTHGRFVRFSIDSGGNYIFCDEIEIYEGDKSFLTLATDEEVITDVKAFAEKTRLISAINYRLNTDNVLIKEIIARSNISNLLKNTLLDQLNGLIKGIADLESPNIASFKTIFPYNDLQASIYAVNGELLSLEKYPRLTFWKKHRYDSIGLFEKPRKTKAEIIIDALRNEQRADSFLVTNAGSEPISAFLTIEGLKGFDNKSAIKVSCVPWTDTVQKIPVTDALPEASELGNRYMIKLPAGLTTPIWFTVDTSKIPPGTYKGNVVISRIGANDVVPIKIRVSKVAMQKPRVSLGMWDYTHANGDRALVPSNMQSAIDMMRSHYVDSPWAQRDLLPHAVEFPEGYFDGLQKWLDRWSGARNYMFFAAVGDNFLGAKINTAEFNSSVGKWVLAIEAYLKSVNIEPARFAMLLIDEPSTDEEDEIVAAWAKAIRNSGSKISIFQDPTRKDLSSIKHQEAFTIPNILCPNMQIYYAGTQSDRDYWKELKDTGHDLWFYQCSGPVRLYDPCLYYRQMAWHAFSVGFVGLGFWSFGDLGGGSSSWNEYVISKTCYAPAFVDPSGVTDSIHWRAVRDGVLDYEYLAMLKDAIESSSNARLNNNAEDLLTDALSAVTGSYVPSYTWKEAPIHKTVDDYRIKIIRMLERYN